MAMRSSARISVVPFFLAVSAMLAASITAGAPLRAESALTTDLPVTESELRQDLARRLQQWDAPAFLGQPEPARPATPAPAPAAAPLHDV